MVCCIVGCQSGSKAYKGPPYTLFRFPKPSAPRMRREWEERVNRVDFTVTSTSVVCSKHFEKRFFKPATDQRGRVRKGLHLTKFAVPSLFLRPGQEKCEEEDFSTSVKDRKNITHDHLYHDEEKFPLPDINNIQNEVTLGESKSSSSDVVPTSSVPLTNCRKCIDQETEIEALKARIRTLERERLQDIVLWEKIKQVLNEDQLRKLTLPAKSTMHWSKETLMEAIHLYYKLGTTAYCFLRNKKKFPLPCIRTLCNHLREIECNPGVLDDFLLYMKKNVESMKEHERICCLCIDEMSLQVR